MRDIHVGDTDHAGRSNRRLSRCPAIKPVLPMVYCGIYPADGADYERPARCAGEAEAERRGAFVSNRKRPWRWDIGFRCGFLGLLHMEIIQERSGARIRPRSGHDRAERRLSRDQNRRHGQLHDRQPHEPAACSSEIDWMEEPFVDAQVYYAAGLYVVHIMELCQDKRGTFRDMKYIDGGPRGCSCTICRSMRSSSISSISSRAVRAATRPSITN